MGIFIILLIFIFSLGPLAAFLYIWFKYSPQDNSDIWELYGLDDKD